MPPDFAKSWAHLGSLGLWLGLTGFERFRMLAARFMGEPSEPKLQGSYVREKNHVAPLCTGVRCVAPPCQVSLLPSPASIRRDTQENISRVYARFFMGSLGYTLSRLLSACNHSLVVSPSYSPSESKLAQLFIESGERGGI